MKSRRLEEENALHRVDEDEEQAYGRIKRPSSGRCANVHLLHR
ncbi:hypothetical protein [Sediminibacillus dalangtanensis]|nr:hypothetical protein [Sediminibacillus dalangtanensis]